MTRKKKVVKLRHRKNFNIGIAVFVVMLFYSVIHIGIYFTKEKISIYEVQEGYNIDDNIFTGFIMREEQIVFSNQAGYISYFQKEGDRVYKNAPVFSVDDSRHLYDIIMNDDNALKITKKEHAEIQYVMKKLQNTYTNDNFQRVYEFKEDIQNTVMELVSNTMIDNMITLQEETGYHSSYEMRESPESGIISYYIDSYEAIEEGQISSSLFEADSYERISLRTDDMISLDKPVYKLITSDQWSIILPLTLEQHGKLLEQKQIEVTLLQDDLTLKAKVSTFQNGSEYFAKLDLDQHMSNYISKRFIDVQLSFHAINGLKIPNTAILEKEFYLIPIEYFTTGGDSGSEGLIKESFHAENGEATYHFIPTDIYYQDETYAYVDTRLFAVGNWIRSATTNDRYQISQMGKLTGVYNVNLGYAVFKRIEVLYSNEEYCIIRNDTSNGLSLYDHIALDSRTAVEQEIIY